MNLRLVRINETHDLSDAAKAACGEFWTIYLYDAEEYTCCEMTPSHWLEAVYFETENPIEESLNDELQGTLYDSSHYRHVSSVKTLPSCPMNGEFESFDDAREWASCNCIWNYEAGEV